jgi:uncharacterized protein (TIGR00369 family)
MVDLTALARQVLSAQPFSVLVKTELGAIAPGRVELIVPIRPELLQQHGFAHGGVVSYAADNAITFAGGSMLGDSVTTEFKINYLRPAIGERLVARAEVVHAGKRQAVCRCDVFAGRGDDLKLCATAQGTVTKVEPKE